ncbi:MAG TPA: DUF3089 domain-containing protein, partial [Sphingomicrobium sp.]|nr:DUF3089 domain-containing protein [Sphingomicrobium sp.]
MVRLIVAAFLSVAAGTALAADPDVPQAPAPDYSIESSWLCLPGRADVCSAPLPTTTLGPNGYGSKISGARSNDPPLDCFYVYPTVSRDPGLNSGLDVADAKGVTAVQFARFSSVCRTFVPIYRQMTVSAVAAYSAGFDITPAAELAYRDVAAAWANYLSSRNHGRPFILVG